MNQTSGDLPEQPDLTRWVDAASLNELRKSSVLEAFVETKIIAIFLDGENVLAIDGLCAHQGGPIASGELGKTDQNKSCVTCPWHGWQYELETGIQTVNRQPLQQVFPVKVDGDRILIGLE